VPEPDDASSAVDGRALADPTTGVALTPAMAARYGARRTPLAARASLWALAIVFVGGVLFLGWYLATPAVQSKVLTWKVVSDQRVDVTFEVRRDSVTDTWCVVSAQDDQHADVGYAQFRITRGRDYVQLTYPLATYATAVSVDVLGCAASAPPRVDPPAFPPGTTNPPQVELVDGS